MHKGSTQTNKRSKLGFKKKGAKKPNCTLVWRTGLVRCPRTVQLRTAHLRISAAPLRYNSPDVRCATGLSGALAEQRLANATVDCNGCLQRYNARTVRAEVSVAIRGVPNNTQYLTGAAPDCPVPQEDKAPTVVHARTLTVG